MVDRTIARNTLQNVLGLARERANWLAEAATEEEILSLSGSATPAEATVRAIAGAVLDRIRTALAPTA